MQVCSYGPGSQTGCLLSQRSRRGPHILIGFQPERLGSASFPRRYKLNIVAMMPCHSCCCSNCKAATDIVDWSYQRVLSPTKRSFFLIITYLDGWRLNLYYSFGVMASLDCKRCLLKTYFWTTVSRRPWSMIYYSLHLVMFSCSNWVMFWKLEPYSFMLQ